MQFKNQTRNTCTTMLFILVFNLIYVASIMWVSEETINNSCHISIIDRLQYLLLSIISTTIIILANVLNHHHSTKLVYIRNEESNLPAELSHTNDIPVPVPPMNGESNTNQILSKMKVIYSVEIIIAWLVIYMNDLPIIDIVISVYDIVCQTYVYIAIIDLYLLSRWDNEHKSNILQFFVNNIWYMILFIGMILLINVFSCYLFVKNSLYPSDQYLILQKVTNSMFYCLFIVLYYNQDDYCTQKIELKALDDNVLDELDESLVHIAPCCSIQSLQVCCCPCFHNNVTDCCLSGYEKRTKCIWSDTAYEFNLKTFLIKLVCLLLQIFILTQQVMLKIFENNLITLVTNYTYWAAYATLMHFLLSTINLYKNNWDAYKKYNEYLFSTAIISSGVATILANLVLLLSASPFKGFGISFQNDFGHFTVHGLCFILLLIDYIFNPSITKFYYKNIVITVYFFCGWIIMALIYVIFLDGITIYNPSDTGHQFLYEYRKYKWAIIWLSNILTMLLHVVIGLLLVFLKNSLLVCIKHRKTQKPIFKYFNLYSFNNHGIRNEHNYYDGIDNNTLVHHKSYMNYIIIYGIFVFSLFTIFFYYFTSFIYT
eukprot:425643_1